MSYALDFHYDTVFYPIPFLECSPDFSTLSLENGDISCSNANKYMSNCRFTCHDGYTVDGDSKTHYVSRNCIDDGTGTDVQWDNSTIPMCQGNLSSSKRIA